MVRPSRIWLTPSEAPEPAPEGSAVVLPLDGSWIAALRDGNEERQRSQIKTALSTRSLLNYLPWEQPSQSHPAFRSGWIQNE